MRAVISTVLMILALTSQDVDADTPEPETQAFLVLKVAVASATTLDASLGEFFSSTLARADPPIALARHESTGPTIELTPRRRREATRALEILSQSTLAEGSAHSQYIFEARPDGVIVARANPAAEAEGRRSFAASLASRAQMLIPDAVVYAQEGRIVIRSATLSPEQLRDRLTHSPLTFHLVVEDRASRGTVLASPYPGLGDESALVEREPLLHGDRLQRAHPAIDESTGRAVIYFEFDEMGAEAFCRITREQIGRRFAILLDGRVLSAPTINEPICGGSGQISGDFTVQSANAIAAAITPPNILLWSRVVAEGYGEPPN